MHNDKPVLIIMAAGVGSRFGGGGLKQVAPVDNGGHIMMDYTIFDAARAGFETVILVIKPAWKRTLTRSSASACADTWN